MPESFGTRLRQRREEQQIALTTIAEQTKINRSLLEALERDDVSHWPSGIFRRAFIRAYAHAIGLEPDVVVREFLELHPDPIEVVATASAIAPGADGAVSSAGPPTRLQQLVGSAIGFLSSFRFDGLQRRPSTSADLAAVDRTPVNAPDPFDADDLFNDQDPFRAQDPFSEPDLFGAPAPFEPDLLSAAHLCAELGRVDETREAAPLLQEAARILDAAGLIVWVWDPEAAELKAALAHGYSDRVLAQLPRVERDTDNATAAAFRSARTCVVNGNDLASGALAVPLMTATGCVGVLGIELRYGREQTGSVRALATIFGAQLARVIAAARPAEAVARRVAAGGGRRADADAAARNDRHRQEYSRPRKTSRTSLRIAEAR